MWHEIPQLGHPENSHMFEATEGLEATAPATGCGYPKCFAQSPAAEFHWCPQKLCRSYRRDHKYWSLHLSKRDGRTNEWIDPSWTRFGPIPVPVSGSRASTIASRGQHHFGVTISHARSSPSRTAGNTPFAASGDSQIVATRARAAATASRLRRFNLQRVS